MMILRAMQEGREYCVGSRDGLLDQGFLEKEGLGRPVCQSEASLLQPVCGEAIRTIPQKNQPGRIPSPHLLSLD
jgi:hypothetical protein